MRRTGTSWLPTHLRRDKLPLSKGWERALTHRGSFARRCLTIPSPSMLTTCPSIRVWRAVIWLALDNATPRKRIIEGLPATTHFYHGIGDFFSTFGLRLSQLRRKSPPPGIYVLARLHAGA